MGIFYLIYQPVWPNLAIFESCWWRFSLKNNQKNIMWVLGCFEKHHFEVPITVMTPVWAIFLQIWDIFSSNIWSHWYQSTQVFSQFSRLCCTYQMQGSNSKSHCCVIKTLFLHLRKNLVDDRYYIIVCNLW